MGVPVLILGESGSGKTYSLKNMPDDTIIYLVEKPRLPFKANKFPKVIVNATYPQIIGSLKLADAYFNAEKMSATYRFTDIYGQTYWTPVMP